MNALKWLAAVMAMVLCSVTAQAQVTSGPNKGEAQPPLKVQLLGENDVYKEQDVSKERGDKPTIYLFIQAESWDRPMFQFIKTLDGLVKKVDENARLVAVWVTDDNDKTKDYLPKIKKYFEENLVTYFEGGKAGPDKWSINGDARITAVVVNKQKVGESFGFGSVNGTDAPTVEKALKDAIGKS